MSSRPSLKLGHLGSKLGHWAKSAEDLVNTLAVFAKTVGLSDKTGKFSFCPAENFSLSDKCPVISGKKR